MKTFLTIVVVLLLGLVGVAAIGGPALAERFQSGEDRGIEVRVEEVAARTLIETISAPGMVRPLTAVQVAAEVSARIVELPVEEGDAVTKGQLLARLDGTELEAQLKARRAARDGRLKQIEAEGVRLEGLRTRLAFASKELERINALHDTGDVSLRELEQAQESAEDATTQIAAAELGLAQLESSLAIDEAEILRAEASLSNTVIVAPIDGFVTELFVELGEVVTGSTTQPGTILMRIADLRRMIHDAEVAESDIARLSVGQVADVHINGYPDRIFKGTVQRIALQRSMSSSGSGYFKTEIELDLGATRVRSGHLANADIRIAEHRELAVPYQAIVTREVESLPAEVRDDPLIDRTRRNTLVVYRLVEGRTVATPVEAGPSDLTHRVVYAGLDDGTTVITGPYSRLERLEHGTEVRVEGAADETTSADTTTTLATPESDAETRSSPEATG